MRPLLNKVFIRQFYSANTGFFFFFFFIFLGAVQSGSLVSYHLSLMESFLQSNVVLLLVFFCWLLYHLKCVSFFLRIINSAEGRFLYNLQALSPHRVWFTCLYLHVAVYAPVLVYGMIVFFVGINRGYPFNAMYVLLFQMVTIAVFTSLLHYRLTHWQPRQTLPGFRLPMKKPYLLFLLFYFTTQRKLVLLVLKIFSLLLLYLVLVWNRGRYDPDAFLLFYLVLLMAHSVLPYFALTFFEKEFTVLRNMPLALFTRGLSFLLPYCVLMLPEAAYLFYAGEVIPTAVKVAYIVNLVACLSLLTAIQYSDAKNPGEYMKAAFGVFFVSIFALHAQAFWFWIAVQFSLAMILFGNGYYRYETGEGFETKKSHK